MREIPLRFAISDCNWQLSLKLLVFKLKKFILSCMTYVLKSLGLSKKTQQSDVIAKIENKRLRLRIDNKKQERSIGNSKYRSLRP